jgi:methionyl-tRNA formyltransferase
MRFAFFGTPALACDILDALAAAGYVPELIVTMPDRPQGRGMQMQQSAVGGWGADRGIEVLKPEKLDDACVAGIRERGIPFAIVVAYGKIVPQTLLDAFPLGMWNIHYSLLPRWRGATPVESAILSGDSETGVAIQRMVYALDAGPIAALERTKIADDETAPALRTRLNAIAAELLVRIMPDLAAGNIALLEQDVAGATRCGKMEKSDGDITHDDDATRSRKYRAYFAWPGTFFFADRGGKTIRVKVNAAHFDHGRFVIDTATPEGKSAMPYATLLASGVKPLR